MPFAAHTEEQRARNRAASRKRTALYRARHPDLRRKPETPQAVHEQYLRRRATNSPHVLSKYRENQLKRKYGLTAAQWDEMFYAQGSVCASCGTDDPKYKYGWVTDHCHATGRVRGILCRPCNLIAGFACDDIVHLTKVTAYLNGRT